MPLACLLLACVLTPASGAIARGNDPDVLRLPGRAIALAPAAGSGEATLTVTVTSTGPESVPVARSDFTLSAHGDMFGVQRWSARRSRVVIRPRRARTFRLTFAAPMSAVSRAALYYRPADGTASGTLPLDQSPVSAATPTGHRSATTRVLKTFPLAGGVGDPWGTAVDSAGNVWFAEPGCDFAPTCGAGARPGQIGRLVPSTGAIDYYTLPDIPGNQPIFLALDAGGNVWFTTPNNSMIGEFSPSTGGYVGQWPVTAGSGPWDLAFANGRLWYTEHLASAVGAFDPATHSFQDFQTPSANSNPYGIAADGNIVWFTENNSSVDRVAALDTRSGAISEYPIVQPFSGTPHLIEIDANGHPWWTEGWSNSIATLDPAVATPGGCGVSSGPCRGIKRFQLPAPPCGGESHTSGMAIGADGDVWLDNSLSGQVGSFTPSTGTFDLTTLSNCGAHPHDGLSIDGKGNVWFDEQFANALGEIVAPQASTPPPPPPPPPPTDGGTPIAALSPANAVPPSIRGVPRQGRVLLARRGSWTGGPMVFTYRWQRCDPRCEDIADTRGIGYRLTAADVDATVRVVVVAHNSAGTAQVMSSAVGPIGPSVRRVKAALGHLLAASAGHLGAITRNGRYAGSFRAPSSGKLTVSWRANTVQLASALRRFPKAGAAQITMPLSESGKRLVERSKRVALVARAVFKPVGEPAVTRRERVTLTAP